MTRDFRYGALERRAGLRARLREVGSDSRSVMAATVGVLLLVPPVVGVVLWAAGGSIDDWGVAGVLALLLVCGVCVLGSLLGRGGTSSAMAAFARDNGLVHVRATAMPTYAGSLFSDGSHIVDQSVRTRDRRFVEVGDRFLVKAPQVRHSTTTERVQVGSMEEPRLFLRGRLAADGGSATQAVVADGDLHDRLTRLAGEHRVEVLRDEVTVFGTSRLGSDRGRISEAFALLYDLLAHLDARLPAPTRGARIIKPVTDPVGPAGSADPAVSEPRRTWGPLRTVALTLVIVLVVPLAFAFVMSILDARGSSTAVMVLAVNGLLAGSGALVALTLRRATGNGPGPGTRRRWPSVLAWTVGGVAFVTLGAFAIGVGETGPGDTEDSEKASAAECYPDDAYCQEEVSTRVWLEDQGLNPADTVSWRDCANFYAQGQALCGVRVQCPGGHAELVVELAGQPLDVTGARGTVARRSDLTGRLGTLGLPLEDTPGGIEELVSRKCRTD